MTNFSFVTQSVGKLAETEMILGRKIEHYNIDLPEIQSVEVEDIVIFKIEKAYAELRRPVMIEDTGLFIEAWNGLPGALIKWFVKSVGESGICTMMNDFPNRAATAKTIVVTYDGIAEPVCFVGEVKGTIAQVPAGNGGFGWDKIFIPNGATRTFGEMLPDEKNSYSMRKIAFEKMLAYYG